MQHRKNMAGLHRRGTAAIEFVCSVPLLAVIIALTFFFGHVRVNQQHVQVAARYSAWVGWYSDYPPGSDEALNSIFMDNRSTDTNLTMEGRSLGTTDDYVEFVSEDSQPAGELATDLIDNYFVSGRRGTVDAVFPSPVNLWEFYEGDIHARSSREGLEWTRDDAFCEYAVAEQLLTLLDSTLRSIPAPGDRVAVFVRGLYLWQW